MSNDKSGYISPFSQRYASKEMQNIFSSEKKFKTWRKIWIALAESEQELGIDISDEQITELKKFADDINFDVADAKEKEIRHDVMSHLYAYGQQAPEGGKILHLGATSAFVGGNTDLMLMKEALTMVQTRLLHVIKNLATFAEKHKNIRTLGFTHFQPAQLTTVGKRGSLWLYDFITDFHEVTNVIKNLKARGVKGTTGTQASFFNLFKGDKNKIKRLDAKVTKKLGFEESFPVTGQTYPRKTDMLVLNSLAGIAVSAHKFATDLRLLANLKELEEPFEKKQVGSSAMAYKRNPMRSERICSISRFLISLSENAPYTAATQWLERTLDDSANRRLSIAESFLAADSVLLLLDNVTSGIVVNGGMIESNLSRELPFMITENLLMKSTEKGGGRQDIHEVIRTHSHKASAEVKAGGKNRLLQYLAEDDDFPLDKAEINAIKEEGNLTGRAAEQVEELIKDEVGPIMKRYGGRLGDTNTRDIL